MPDRSHRDQVFKILKPHGDPTETSLVNLRTTKQLADLYLVHTGHRNWRAILEREGVELGREVHSAVRGEVPRAR
jgi:hypothetical protein